MNWNCLHLFLSFSLSFLSPLTPLSLPLSPSLSLPLSPTLPPTLSLSHSIFLYIIFFNPGVFISTFLWLDKKNQNKVGRISRRKIFFGIIFKLSFRSFWLSSNVQKLLSKVFRAWLGLFEVLTSCQSLSTGSWRGCRGPCHGDHWWRNIP